ncbi:MAG: hypothetical protein WC205_08085 [Opitutaceae bacterium]|jgi:hypothetical protein
MPTPRGHVPGSTGRQDRRSPRHHARGFALLITITLLAFLVLLLVSLASLTRVETQVAANNQTLAQARQNSLMAINIALGQLQKYTGPDQRVTATADLLGNRHLDRKRWTGVWNADPASSDHGKNIVWLVSGTAPAGDGGMDAAVTAGAGEELVDLVGDHSADTSVDGERVRVETESINAQSVPGLPSDPAGHKVGAFAYWIGDEGVKAKISLVDPHADQGASERLYSFLIAQRRAGELVTTGAGDALGSDYPVDSPLLDKVFSGRQLPLVATAPTGQDALRSVARSRFHDLTFASRSVLADVVDGGLRKDLTAWLSSATPATGAPADDDFIIGGVSAADAATDRLPRWGLVRSYAGLTGDATTPVAPSRQTDTAMGLYPIITYVRLGVGLSCEGDGLPLKVHLFPEVVLWNPWNVPLSSGLLKVGMRLSGTIDFQVGGTVKTRLNLTRAALDVTGTWPPDYFRFDLDMAAPLQPGESLVFTPTRDEAAYGSADATLIANSPPNQGGSLVMEGPALSAAERAQDMTWSDPGGGEIYLTLWPGSSAATDTSDDLQTISRVGYGSPGVPGAEPVPEAILGARLQYRVLATMSRSPSTHVSSRWIAQQNIRAPVVDRSGAESGTLPLFYCLTNSGASMPTIAVDGNHAAAGLSVSRVAGSPDRLVLYGLRPPGVPLFSLAELQHANLALAGYYPGYAASNSLPSAAIPLGQTLRKDSGWSRGVRDLSYGLNEALWDRYFFSTVPVNLTPANIDDRQYHLPDACLVFAHEGAPAPADMVGSGAFNTAAAHLWLDGGFNVNSTSVEAWKALLGARNGLEYDPAGRADGPALAYPFSRFTVPVGTANQSWEGWRELSSGAVDGLARRIVEQVKARGPFLSLSDFVNRDLTDNPVTPGDERQAGALQAALDAQDTDSGVAAADRINLMSPFDTDEVVSNAGTSWDLDVMRGGATSAYPRSSRSAFAPGYLTQADILNGIGPMLAARSDTFVIRAYGDARNPVTGDVEGRAWCEAVVQRMHDFANTADTAETWPPTDLENQTFGRRFKVVSFRWLNQEDL